MSDEEYRQEGINMQLKPIKERLDSLEKKFEAFKEGEDDDIKEIGILREKLDVWRNEANNIITELKERLTDKSNMFAYNIGKIIGVLREFLYRCCDCNNEDLIEKLDSKNK